MYDVKVYSLAAEGGRQVTPHFKVREFACNDGSDPVFISQALADILENIRVHFGKPVHINSGYRTGDRVIYNGHIYESTINNNVWSPDTYPQGWTELGPVGGPYIEEDA